MKVQDLARLTRAGISKWSSTNPLGMERAYIEKVCTAAAEDGQWYTFIEELYPDTIKWLRAKGFTVIGNDDNGYHISWGGDYKWRA